ncbi:MAG: 2-succinyl-5-enolpyruvyl-6-hydroxy-3-cyclohexene-1-carboxylic-acid synthase [Clostridium sp.]|nr:2-succinyl-5-enolpyruvyl-6-hydroxy-3-cyclohexene-1-carboxylic-acid synthase [Clostridium sp.]
MKTDEPTKPTTDKTLPPVMARLLAAHGVRRAIVSPGTRNAPVITALDAEPALELTVVADERSAAFVALGAALASGSPVALVCTSGTALYNYAPAVAEAYYRHIPLIVISADRPAEWIGQDDSQTLLQPGALSKIVKQSYALTESDTPDRLWGDTRDINDALLLAAEAPRGPVHLNIPLSAPLSGLTDRVSLPEPKLISAIRPECLFQVRDVRRMSLELASPERVLIVAGFMDPDSRLRRALTRLAALENVVVVAEPGANLGEGPWLGSAEALVALASRQPLCNPDRLITLGGSIVSGRLKAWLRSQSPRSHWHVGLTRRTVDTYRCLTLRIEADPSLFMPQLASAMQPHKAKSPYQTLWRSLARKARSVIDGAIDQGGWSAVSAMRMIASLAPASTNIQLSNGMTVRYFDLLGRRRFHRVDSNRGVSGIDGSTSTSVGASTAYGGGKTLLLSGDLSAQYDLGGLSCGLADNRFRMVIFDNGGGAIFRHIAATRSLPTVATILAARPSVSWRDIAAAIAMRYFEAESGEALICQLGSFWQGETAAILLVRTDPERDVAIHDEIFSRLKQTDINRLN